jgi:hypothetical protein
LGDNKQEKQTSVQRQKQVLPLETLIPVVRHKEFLLQKIGIKCDIAENGMKAFRVPLA